MLFLSDLLGLLPTIMPHEFRHEIVEMEDFL
jgi:hypothetical protein